MTGFANGIVGNVADLGDFEIGIAEFEFVADFDIGFELADRVLNDHSRQIGVLALIQQNDAAVVFEELPRLIADGGNHNFIFDFHNDASLSIDNISGVATDATDCDWWR